MSNRDVDEITKRVMGRVNGLVEVAYHKRTICEVHREIWDIVDGIEYGPTRDSIQALVIIAYDMAKRMGDKLIEGKSKRELLDIEKELWEPNKDFEQDRLNRASRGARVLGLRRGKE